MLMLARIGIKAATLGSTRVANDLDIIAQDIFSLSDKTNNRIGH